MCSPSGNIQDPAACSGHSPSCIVGSDIEPDSSSRQDYPNHNHHHHHHHHHTAAAAFSPLWHGASIHDSCDRWCTVSAAPSLVVYSRASPRPPSPSLPASRHLGTCAASVLSFPLVSTSGSKRASYRWAGCVPPKLSGCDMRCTAPHRTRTACHAFIPSQRLLAVPQLKPHPARPVDCRNIAASRGE